ncbi:hypothetical protein I4I73_15230 [Pseudonocardia sp. KRD-184]|uniref:WXG100 family type VII secretion target n=1 Tax=Pseudonocardia oceani TaxID=2792013 RepID=A0ABS6UFS7_9PSEU|nr:hypothetical protein [Pseudonocardia oceani]MBW0090170.1 hypothetical protein [Pseudonocardia oceani]MBW0097338.1 hypothetical protein [Pseudonocardia oceani]MBW0110460.1 hypothetical protein [Pseudonocardia oceani]MBW0121232.1 hypothetical protein [Pseudonocardia oceani]MBW0131085.1 hypothetical protein [Pseudonocardia oceani]
MTDYPPATLRVGPGALSRMRAAYEDSLVELRVQLRRLGEVGYLAGPWLGDPVSRQTFEFYNRRVMDAPDGPYQALLAYEAELVRVRDQLAAMEADYRRTEDENTALVGRL